MEPGKLQPDLLWKHREAFIGRKVWHVVSKGTKIREAKITKILNNTDGSVFCQISYLPNGGNVVWAKELYESKEAAKQFVANNLGLKLAELDKRSSELVRLLVECNKL